MNIKKFTNILVLILSLGSVILFIFLVKRYPASEILEPLSKVGLGQILILIGLTPVYFLLYTLRWKRIIKLAGYNVSFKKLLSYRLAGFSFSYLTPLATYGGEPITAYFLSEDNPDIEFSQSFSSVIVSRVISAIPELFFLITSVSYILFFLILPPKINFIFYILLGIIILLPFSVYYIILKNKRPLTKITCFFRLNKIPFVKKIMPGIKKLDFLLNKIFRSNPKELIINISISFLALGSIIFMFWILAKSLGISLSFIESITSRSLMSIIGGLIPVPANIGVGEAGQSVWFSMIGLGAAQGFGFYLLIRAKDIIITTIGVIILINKGFIRNLSKIREKIKDKSFLKKLPYN